MTAQNEDVKVSIITPFLNADKFLEESIESVLAQTYRNWELILMDDGSTDGSAAIAKRYAATYPEKIFYYCHENNKNLGGSTSRNVAIKKCSGEFIAYVDADDIFLPDKLKDQVAILNSQPQAGMLYSSTEYWYSWTGLQEDSNRDWVWKQFGVKPNTLVQPPDLLTMFLRNGGTVPCVGSLLLRRQAIEAVGGWEETFTNIYTDQGFYGRFLLRWPVYVAEGCWDRYRQQPDSCCHVVERTNQSFQARHKYLTWLHSHLQKQGVQKNTELWKAFSAAYAPYRNPRLHRLKKRKDKLFSYAKKALSLLLHPGRFVYRLQQLNKR